ncbi:3-dehydroquinate synthase [Chitinophaga costaii]|uniref:3-dehydroquinate synthase n=1 Tax=Chitinophaga costaii TaxID=1335309 RepID=A0A1C4BGN2_9BACT|nr:3-dehydroquinate synthase [Chitinophaga costaii]PUZ27621.1 3-dehydroquinate synthase [Chitinophaga costaii]SCC05894.1 3-dehydroquinate synthase [Chitinophaga costaii]
MQILEQVFKIPYKYQVYFTTSLFDTANPVFSDFLASHQSEGLEQKLLFVIDEEVQAHHPQLMLQITTYVASLAGFSLAPIQVLPGGEASKNDPALFDQLIHAVEQFGIDRHSYLVAIGGGSLLDLAGYAAAVSHRGVRHIRIPTTVLSQNDSGVGVKNGINYQGKKNFLGTFAPPVAVFNDSHFLTTLHARDWAAGMAEAVKVALIKDAAFFAWLEQAAPALAAREMAPMQELIYRCAALHMAHIGGGDPFESGSSRPLDFGHWSAHKLEPLTHFSLRHGEAVSIGIALDSVYSFTLGWISESDMQRIVHLLYGLGLPTWHPLLDAPVGGENPVFKGLEEFREHLGGQLTITLLRAIGQGEEVHQINLDLLQQAAALLKIISEKKAGASLLASPPIGL